MEEFDILNEEGKPTGAIADKGTKLNKGQYYLGVHAYIYNSFNQFLLQQRAFDKDFLPGGWDIHMGHVMAGESSKEGVIREIREEIGLNFEENNIRFIERICWEIYNHFFDIYFLKADFNLDELSLQKTEVIDVKLVSKNDMLALVLGMDYRPEEYRRIVTEEINNLD